MILSLSRSPDAQQGLAMASHGQMGRVQHGTRAHRAPTVSLMERPGRLTDRPRRPRRPAPHTPDTLKQRNKAQGHACSTSHHAGVCMQHITPSLKDMFEMFVRDLRRASSVSVGRRWAWQQRTGRGSATAPVVCIRKAMRTRPR